jgi:hypothetical protein
MAKFVVVSSAPEKLEKGELVITQPDFQEQITANAKKAPRVKHTALNHMREVLQSIAVKYDPEMNVMKIKLYNYEGVPYKDDAEFGAILVRLLRNEYPAVFDKYLEHELKNRPQNTTLIYYVGNFTSTTPFFKAGIDHLEEKDLAAYKTGKPKRVVGKPAVTNEEAADGTTE